MGDLPQWEDVPQREIEESYAINDYETQPPILNNTTTEPPDEMKHAELSDERNENDNHRPEDAEFIRKWIKGPDVPYLSSDELPNQGHCLSATITNNDIDQDIPKNAKHALFNKLWNKSMEDEFNAHIKLGTWELVERKPDMNIIGSTWTYRIKRNEFGTPIKHKSRLCAQGFNQLPGIDYNDTFAPVVEVNTIRLLLAYSASKPLNIYQADMPTAYLNAKLNEKIFMKQPTGFEIQPNENK